MQSTFGASNERVIVTLDELQLGPDQRGALIGASGCGKSELARQLMPSRGHLGIIDPKRMFDYDVDIEIYEDPVKLIRKKPKRFIYRPTVDRFADMRAYDAVYKLIYERGNGFCYTDDPVGILSSSRYPTYFQAIYQMGRAKKVAALTAFQRPTWVPLFCMSEARKFYVFDFPFPDDVKRISAMIKGYTPELVAEEFSFAFYETRNPKFKHGALALKLELPDRR